MADFAFRRRKGAVMSMGYFFGTDGDWYSQHTAIAESLRQVMRETGSLIPQYIPLGGGSSVYDFSYYGLLRPDVVISCLLPGVDMRVIVGVYALLGAAASLLLCYLWLKKNGRRRWSAGLGALLFGAAACFYQAHHQIMFINYMPFLFLAFLGVDRCLERKKSGLLVVSLFFLYLHSFYYSIAGLFAVGLYALYRMMRRQSYAFGRLILAVALSLGLAMVFLLPTGLSILSTSKDGGSFAAEKLSAVDMSLEGLLYSPYGCGMTLLSFYCLLLALGKRTTRLLSAALLAAMAFPAVSLVLNGFLYARAKILIPLAPLVVLVVSEMLEELWEGRRKAALIPLGLCLLPVIGTQWEAWEPLILADAAFLALWALLLRRNISRLRFGWIFVFPLIFSVCVHASAPYLPVSDKRQEMFDGEEISEVVRDSRYRYENLANNFVNSNLLPNGHTSRASMYSSVTNDRYSVFFYDTLGNAISANNRVALTPGKNPCFLYFMGVRYVLARADNLPYGYEVVEERDGYVLAENPDVLPMCYGTSRLMNAGDYETLSFPENLAALCSRAVVEGGADGREAAGQEPAFQKEPVATEFADSVMEAVYSSAGTGERTEIPLPRTLKNEILVFRFRVSNPNGKAVEITVNGTKNKLSADSAPYPNENREFTYVLHSGEKLEALEVKASGKNFSIENIEWYTADAAGFHNADVAIPRQTTGKQSSGLVFEGEISMEKDGYFVTSYPMRKGFEVLVDGKTVEGETVNTAFLGFPLKAGEHHVSIRYQAPGYLVGLCISTFSLLLFAARSMWEAQAILAGRQKRKALPGESEVVLWNRL